MLNGPIGPTWSWDEAIMVPATLIMSESSLEGFLYLYPVYPSGELINLFPCAVFHGLMSLYIKLSLIFVKGEAEAAVSDDDRNDDDGEGRYMYVDTMLFPNNQHTK